MIRRGGFSRKIIHMCSLLRIRIPGWLIRRKRLLKQSRNKENGRFSREKFSKNIKVYSVYLKKN